MGELSACCLDSFPPVLPETAGAGCAVTPEQCLRDPSDLRGRGPVFRPPETFCSGCDLGGPGAVPLGSPSSHARLGHALLVVRPPPAPRQLPLLHSQLPLPSVLGPAPVSRTERSPAQPYSSHSLPLGLSCCSGQKSGRHPGLFSSSPRGISCLTLCLCLPDRPRT